MLFGVSNLVIAISVVLASLGVALFKFLRARLFFWNLPTPPNHSFLWGHIPFFEEVIAKFPPNTHPQNFYTYMAQKYSLPGIFYIDCWPFMEPQMVITDPDAAKQILTVHTFPKHATIEKFLRPFTGPDSIAASNGTRWKYNHQMVGSGFTPTYVKPMAGLITEQVLIFHDRLKTFAESGQPFSMEEEAAKCVFDVIGKNVFGFSLEAQRAGSPLLEDLRATINPATTFLATRNPWKRREANKRIQALRGRVFDRLSEEMQGRLRILRDEKELPSRRKAKSIMDRIVLDKLQREPDIKVLEKSFLEDAVANLKALLLGGHGTTTDTFVFITMFLSLYPDVVKRLREEHNEAFHPDLGTTVEMLVENPNKTNDLDYTNAVIKETLRFYPIGFTIRSAPSGVSQMEWNGRKWPVKNLMVIPSAHTTQMDPAYWKEPGKFRPERFLGEEGAEIDRFAWRPFERGPRACIAQDLAMDELRILLILTVRWFDFETIVGEKTNRVMYFDLDKEVGDLAFQEVGMEARPRHTMQMKIHLASKEN